MALTLNQQDKQPQQYGGIPSIGGLTGLMPMQNGQIGQPASVSLPQKPSVPTVTEGGLNEWLYEYLNKQTGLQDRLLPLQLEAAGLVDDGKGGLRKMTPDEKLASMSPLERAQYDFSMDELGRMGKASRGELELPTWLQSDLDKQSDISDEAISRAYGPNPYASTGGIQAKTAQTTEGTRIKDAYRHGELELGSKLFGQFAGGANSMNQQTLGNYTSLPSVYSPILSNLNTTKSPWTQTRLTEMNNDAQENAAMWGGLGSIAGAGLGALIMSSDRRLKTNIKRIGTSPKGFPWYSFDYLWGQHSEGVMADEVPHARIMGADGFWMVDYSLV